MKKEQKDKRSEIMQAALELVSEKGFQGAPTAMIAKRANVGIGSLYRYFKSKDELIYAIHLSLKQKLNGLVETEKRTFREGFYHNYKNLCVYLNDHPLEFKFLNQFYNSIYGVSHRKKIIASDEWGIIATLFKHGIEKRIIKNLPIELICSLVLGPIEFIFRTHDAKLLTIDDKFLDDLINATWDALKQ
jgi:TetR/AcrR family transcriptional regulator, repressor of fatR-cypB operon